MNDNPSDRTKRTGRGSRQFYARPFIGVPKALAGDATVTPAAKALWMAIVLLAWEESHDPVDRKANGVTFAQFAAVVGVSEPTLRKAAAELEQRGWIAAWKRGQGLANGYEAHLDPHARDERFFGGTPKESCGSRAGASTGGELEQPLEQTVAAAPRKRDIVFDAMAEATNSDPHLEGARIGTAIAKLRKHPDYLEYVGRHSKDAADELLAVEVLQRADAFRDKWPELTLTPTGLVSNWRRLVEVRQSSRYEQAMEALRQEREGAA